MLFKKTIVFICLFIFLIPMFSSCSNPAESIVGGWKDENGTLMHFYADGNFFILQYNYEKKVPGTYSINGNKLTLYSDESADTANPSETHTFSLKGDILTIVSEYKDENGEDVTENVELVRVK
jgi:hypothetical protein